MRRAAKVDGNQKAIVKALRACGITVAVTSALGDGFPDLVCFREGSGIKLLECKLPGEKLTSDQQEFALDWPVNVVHSEEEALGVFGIV